MAVQYTEVTLEDMERFLKRGFRVLRPKRGEQNREVYFDLYLSGNVAIRVWTSVKVGTGIGAGVGQDAIRIQLVSIPRKRPLMKGKAPIVKRTQNWRNSLQNRIEDAMEAYEDREEYWEDRATGEALKTESRPPAPDGISGPPPSDKQVDFAMSLVHKAPENFNWTQYGFDTTPDEEGVRSLSGKSVSKMIDALKSAGPDPVADPVREERRVETTATFTKLQNGDWGVRGQNLVEGDTVTVVRKNGTKAVLQVGRVVWTGRDGTAVAEIARSSGRYAAELLGEECFLDAAGPPDLYGSV